MEENRKSENNVPTVRDLLCRIADLAKQISWSTNFKDWLATRFGILHITSHMQADLVIKALERKLRNQKPAATIHDPSAQATPEQLATIERLSKAIDFSGDFNEWLLNKCRLRKVTSYEQAERVIGHLKDKLKAQLQNHDQAPSRETARHLVDKVARTSPIEGKSLTRPLP